VEQSPTASTKARAARAEVDAALAALERAGRVRTGVEVTGWPGRFVVSA
jgi:hypothetical protein